MKVKSAKNTAIQWVMQYAAKEEWFQGAYFSGSIIGMADDEEMSAYSDVDIVVICALDEPPLKLGKIIYHGVLLEVTYLTWNQLSSVEDVLTSYHLAGSFRTDTIITDPTGRIRVLQLQVSQHFAEKAWVRRRCENAFNKSKNGLLNINFSAPFYDLVTSWLFPTGITTHVILVAALRNPTVRRRYLAAREVLTEYGYNDIYKKLIELLGCYHLTQQEVEKHLDNLEQTFDAAVKVSRTPFSFSSDITEIARPISIDGSRELIRAGNHHEAVFWIAATFARCHKILAADAPMNMQDELMPAFEELVADLGMTSRNDFKLRREEVLRFLPIVWETAEDILSRNPDIKP